MLSHGCFFAALLVYYISKALAKKTKLTVNLHIILGSLATVGMLYETVVKFGTESFLKYFGFSCIMLAIVGTGCLTIKNKKLNIRWHIISTISFFIYLILIIL